MLQGRDTPMSELDRQIRQRAYDIWESQGRPDGRAVEHWRQAQAEVQALRAMEVRSAGRKEMLDPPADWDIVDEQSDESFPASDPPGNY
jgi:hypothetical protein